MRNNQSDILLEDLGYDPKRWREQNERQYKQMKEGKKFYHYILGIDINKHKIITVEPWEGQRP